jgi:serine/threonine protein kinase
MSPEQARGREAGTRADVWAFGAVLYELLTARQTFPGDTMTDVLATVLKNDPDWSALPPSTPEAVRSLLRRCLEKDFPAADSTYRRCANRIRRRARGTRGRCCACRGRGHISQLRTVRLGRNHGRASRRHRAFGF